MWRTPDMFPAVDRPLVVSAEDASFLKDNDEVLGFVINGQARAYPTVYVSYHHIVNDELAGCHLTVTY